MRIHAMPHLDIAIPMAMVIPMYHLPSLFADLIMVETACQIAALKTIAKYEKERVLPLFFFI